MTILRIPAQHTPEYIYNLIRDRAADLQPNSTLVIENAQRDDFVQVALHYAEAMPFAQIFVMNTDIVVLFDGILQIFNGVPNHYWPRIAEIEPTALAELMRNEQHQNITATTASIRSLAQTMMGTRQAPINLTSNDRVMSAQGVSSTPQTTTTSSTTTSTRSITDDAVLEEMIQDIQRTNLLSACKLKGRFFNANLPSEIKCSIDPINGILEIVPKVMVGSNMSFEAFFSPLKLQGKMDLRFGNLNIFSCCFHITNQDDISQFEKSILSPLKPLLNRLEAVDKRIPVTYFQKLLLISLGSAIYSHYYQKGIASPLNCPWIDNVGNICLTLDHLNKDLIGLEEIYNFVTQENISIHKNIWILLHRYAHLDLEIREDVYAAIDNEAEFATLSPDEMKRYQDLRCPIALSLMRTPVTAFVETGESHLYDEKSLTDLIHAAALSRKKPVDPLTRANIIQPPNGKPAVSHLGKRLLADFIDDYAKARNLTVENGFIVTRATPANEGEPQFLDCKADINKPLPFELTASVCTSSFGQFTQPNISGSLKRSYNELQSTVDESDESATKKIDLGLRSSYEEFFGDGVESDLAPNEFRWGP